MILAGASIAPLTSPSPAATCDRSAIPIAIVSTLPKVTVYPGYVKEKQLEVLVRISVNAQGDVTDARVEKSSGSTVIDDAAVAVARKRSHTPKMVDCRAIPSTYIVREVFERDTPSQ